MVAKMEASTDVDLVGNVLLYLKRLSELSADGLSVKSNGEILTPEGFVRSREEKRAAEKAALEVYGIKAVASGIVIKPLPERDDAEIAGDVLHKFQSYILLPTGEVKAIVSNGLVTLEGVVPSQFQKLLAEAAVKTVRGIRGIRNNIEVESEVVSTRVVRAADQSGELRCEPRDSR